MSHESIRAILSSGDEFCLRWMLTLLHFCWQGAAIGAIVYLLDRCMRVHSAADRYLLHTCAFFSLPVCVAVTYCIVQTPPLDSPRVELAKSEMTASALVVGAESSGLEGDGSAPNSISPRDFVRASVEEEGASEPVLSATDTVEKPLLYTQIEDSLRSMIGVLSPLAPWMVAVYFFGSLVFLTRLSLAVWGGQRLCASATRLEDPELLGRIDEQCRRLGLRFAPAVAFCQRVTVPTVVGVVRPIVLLPASLLSGLDPIQFDAVISHELAHIRRLDLLINLMQRVIESILFFHPVVWWMSRRMSAERETCCDDLVVGCGYDRMQYAGALLQMAEHCSSAKSSSVSVAATGRDPSQLEWRIRRLMDPAEVARTRLTRVGAAAFLLLTVAAAATPAAVHSWSQDKGTPQPTDAAPAPELLGANIVNSAKQDDLTTVRNDNHVERNGDPTEFRGIKIANYPATTDPHALSDLYQETPAGSGVYEWAPETCFMPFDGPFSALYVAPKGVFFLRRETQPKMTYYGPIAGDPLVMLDMEPYMLERIKEFGTAGNVRITISRMLACGNPRLTTAAIGLLQQIVTDSDTLDSVRKRGQAAGQASRNLDLVQSLLQKHEARLRSQGKAEQDQALDRLKLASNALEAMFEAAQPVIPAEQYNDASHRQRDIPDYAPIQWGPENNGLRLGLVGATPFTAKQGKGLHPFELVLHNVGDHEIRTQVGYAAEWLRAVVKDSEGKDVRTEFGDVGSSLHPLTTLWRLKPGEKLHVCGNRLTIAAPAAKVATTAFRRMDWLITRVRATPGRYTATYQLPLNVWRTRRGKGEWFGTLTSSEFSFQVAPPDGQPLDPDYPKQPADDVAPPKPDDPAQPKVRAPKEPAPKKTAPKDSAPKDSAPKEPQPVDLANLKRAAANGEPVEKTPEGRFKIRFDNTPLMDVIAGYAEEVGYALDAVVEPKAMVTHHSPRLYDFTSYRRLVLLESLKAGFYLDDTQGDRLFVVRMADDMAAEKAKKLQESKDLFGGRLSVLDYRVYRHQQQNAPPAPGHVYTLAANEDLSAGQVNLLLAAKLHDKIAFTRPADGVSILADAYATRFDGKLRYCAAPALRKGETMEVFANTVMTLWNAYDPNPPIATVSGKITDEGGSPIPNLSAEYMVLGDARFDRPVGGKLRVNPNGEYSFGVRRGGFVQSPSSFYLIANAPGFAPVQIHTKAIPQGKDNVMNIVLPRGFDGLLEFESDEDQTTVGGVIEVKAFDLRHSPLFEVKTGARWTRIPNCGELPLLLNVKIPGFVNQEFRNVKFVEGRVTRLKLKSKLKPLTDDKLQSLILKGYFEGEDAKKLIRTLRPAWGKSQLGVQFGVSHQGEQRKFKSGERVPLAMFVRNVSQNTVRVKLAMDFLANVPTVLDANQKPLPITSVNARGAVMSWRRVLKPGEAAGFRHHGLGLGENPAKGKRNWTPAWQSPEVGNYQLSHTHKISVEVLDQANSTRSAKFTTGALPFAVVVSASSSAPAKVSSGGKGSDAGKPEEKHANDEGNSQTAASHQIVRLKDHLNVRDVVYLKQGDVIQSVATEHAVTIRVWDAKSGALHSESTLETEAHGNSFLNGSLKFSRDGTTVLAVLRGKVKLWKAPSGKSMDVRIPQDYRASIAAISFDGRRLATANALQGDFGLPTTDAIVISVWDARNGERLRQFTHEKARQLHGLAFSPDGSLLCSSSQENGVAVWDVSAGQKRHHFHHGQYNAHLKHPQGPLPLPDTSRKQVLSAAFHPDNRILAASDAFGVKLWDLEKGQLLHILPAPYRYGRSHLAFSPSGKYLVRSSCGKEVIVWRPQDGRVVQSYPTGSGCAVFSPSESHIAIGFSDRKQALSVWPFAPQ